MRKLRGGGRQLELFGTDVGVVGKAEGEEARAEPAQLVGEPAPVLVADVDCRRRAVPVDVGLGEEPPLRVEVGAQRAVEVEVVLRQVREDERPEARPDEPLQLGRVRGGLHRTAPVAGVEELAEGALEVDCLGRRPGDGPPLAPHPHLDGAEQARSPAGRGEDRVEQERRRRLSVRPRDARHLELACRAPEEHVRREGHCEPGVVDDQLGHGQVERTLDEERRSAALDHGGGEVVAVSALPRDAGEERSRLDPAGVVGEIRDGDRRRVQDVASADGVAQGLERDGGLVGHGSGEVRHAAWSSSSVLRAFWRGP